jgi:ferredoxin
MLPTGPAIKDAVGADVLHHGRSYASRTACRIEHLEGEPEKMTQAELEVLERKDLIGQARLSCQ